MFWPQDLVRLTGPGAGFNLHRLYPVTTWSRLAPLVHLRFDM